MSKDIEVPKIERAIDKKLRMIAKRNGIKYRSDETDESIRKRTIEELNRRKEDAKYEKYRGFIKISLLHCEGCGEREYAIRL